MGLFKKKTEAGILPEEVNQYYLSQRRERRGVMFILSLLALLATVLIGLAVFFGGRYLYNKTRSDDKKPTVSTVQTQDKVDNSSDLDIRSNTDNSAKTSTQSPSPSSTTNTSNTDQSSTSQTTNLTPATTPNTGDDTVPTELPKTGDEGR